jgi:hypothetical protein
MINRNEGIEIVQQKCILQLVRTTSRRCFGILDSSTRNICDLSLVADDLDTTLLEVADNTLSFR